MLHSINVYILQNVLVIGTVPGLLRDIFSIAHSACVVVGDLWDSPASCWKLLLSNVSAALLDIGRGLLPSSFSLTANLPLVNISSSLESVSEMANLHMYMQT